MAILLALGLGTSSTDGVTQDTRWDSLLSNSHWYVPVPGLIAYASGTRSFTNPPPVPVGDQTLWAIGQATNGLFSGQSQISLLIGGETSNSSASMQGLVTSSGQIAITFTSAGSPTTLGIGQMREIGGVPLMEMQMMTGTDVLVTHWAYMTPYNPNVFTPPAPSQVVIADITSPQWRWTAGTTWRLISERLFGTAAPGTFKITDYSNGYYWGLGASPQGSAIGNFTVLGSITPEGNVLFSMLSGGVLNSLAGQAAGDETTGTMVLRPYGSGGTFGSPSLADIMPASDIAAGQTFFISNVGASVTPAFSGGTLQVDTRGQAYAQDFTLSGSPSNRLDQRGNSALLSGVLSDAVPGTPGRLVVTNSGIGGHIALAGASTYTGPTTVEAGATLLVNGSIVSPVTVDGRLGGSGMVGSTSINGGVLAPGNSIGTLTVTGNLSFGPGSIYAVELSPTAADRTNVTGAASLQGTTAASFDPGSYSPRRHVLLSAAGGLSGAFGGLATIGLPEGFLASLSYTSTDVLLTLTAALGRGTSLSGNQSAVAAAINKGFNSGNDLPAGLSALFTQSGSGLASSLSSLSGEAHAGLQVSAFRFGNLFLNTALAGGARNDASRGAHYASLMANEAGPAPRPLRGWLAGFGGYGWLAGATSSGASAVQTSAQGIAAGVDWTSEGNILGVTLAGGTANWFLDGGLGSGRANVVQGGLYGRATLGQTYVAAAAAWGQHSVTTQRPVPYLSDWLTASYTATTWSGRAEIGHRFGLGAHGLTPFAAGQGQLMSTPGFCEASPSNSGTALCSSANSASSLRSELGIQGDANLGSIVGSMTTVTARLAWAHEFQPNGLVSAWFPSLPGSSFMVTGAPLPSDMAIMRLTSDHALDEAWSFRLQADAEFANGYGSLAGTARLTGRF